MKLAFEVTRTISSQPTGINRYARQLISAVAAGGEDTQIELFYKLEKLAKRRHWLKTDNIPARLHFGNIWPLFNIPDIVHGLDGYVPEWKNAKKIVTIHDIFPLIKDHDTVSPKGFSEMIRSGYSRMFERADVVVTVSENTRLDVIKHFQINESKIVTVYPGHGMRDLTSGQELDKQFRPRSSRDYLLFLGAISGRKNTERIVRAYSKSKAKDDFDLLLVGSLAYKGESTIEAIAELGLENRVKVCGYVPDDEMTSIFRNASGLVFPTLYEGFGFPILEAMMLEVPVLTSNLGSAAEVAGGHAILADPYDVESIAAGIDKLVEAGSTDQAAAKKHAMGFTWKKCAGELLGVYEALLENS